MVGPDRFELSIDGLKVRCDTSSPRSLIFCKRLRALLLLRCEPARRLLANTANMFLGFIAFSLFKIGRGYKNRTYTIGIKIRCATTTPIPNCMVRVEGFEPSVSCSQSRRIRPDFPTLGYKLITKMY